MFKLRSDMYVELLTVAGSDATVVESALVSSGKNPVKYGEDKKKGLIFSLLHQKHGSPFESGYLEFHIEAPRAVRDEHVRHRIGSYSSSSLRYKMDEPELYVPPPWRPLQKAENFRQMRPEYVVLGPTRYQEYVELLSDGYAAAYEHDQRLLAAGFTETEARRWLTNDGMYVAYRARFNPRSLMAFLSLRTHDCTANHVSFPLWEINDVANHMEAIFAEHFPITHAAFDLEGREAP